MRALIALLLLTSTLPAAEPTTFAEVVKAHFGAWDKNRDGELVLDEINKAVIDPAVKGHEAAAVAALRRYVRNAKTAPAKLTQDEIVKRAGQKVDSTDDEQAKAPGSLIAYYTSANTRIAKANRDLFPKAKPSLDALSQGKLGDCFCLAPLGGLCSRDPEEVVKLFTKKDDGTYDVKLGKHSFNVPSPTDAEIALSGNAHEDGVWVNVYEKAVGAMRMQALPEKERPVTSLDLLNKGGSAGTMMGTLTGHEIERFPLTMFKDDAKHPEEKRTANLKELRTKLIHAFEQKNLVTTGTNKTLSPKPADINGNHAYAILGYDSVSDLIRVWNPHGQTFTPKGSSGLEHGYATKGGRFEMPLPEFVKVFAGLAFEVK